MGVISGVETKSTNMGEQVAAYWVEECRRPETGERYYRVMRARAKDPQWPPTVMRSCLDIGLAWGVAGILAEANCDEFNRPCYESVPDWVHADSGPEDRMVWVAYRDDA